MAARLVFCLLVSLSLAACGRHDPDTTPTSEAAANTQLTDTDIAANNRGVALMGYFDYSAARNVFADVVGNRPQWHDAKVNLAIATLNRQQDGDEARALAIVGEVLAADPGNLRAAYISGLLNLYLGESDKAEAYFRAVTAGAPDDAYAAYYLGQVLVQNGRLDDALVEYKRAMGLDPYLRSAYYGAALAMRRVGRSDDAATLLQDYQRFENNPRARLAEFKYTRMGPLADTIVTDRVATDAQAPAAVTNLFAAPVTLAQLPTAGSRRTLTTVDLDADGDQDLVVTRAGPGESNVVLLQNADAGFAPVVHPLAASQRVNAVAWGDIDNDGLVDAYFCNEGANQYWRQSGPGSWADNTAETQTGNGRYDCADVLLVDADHDGDLDIFVVNRNGPNELFNNNLNGSFRALAADSRIGGRAGSVAAIATDLDNDRDVDLVVIKTQPPHEIFINDRLWQYRLDVPDSGWSQQPVSAAVAADLEGDGINDIVVTRQKADAQISASLATAPAPDVFINNSLDLELNLTEAQRNAIAAQAREVDRLLHQATQPTLSAEAVAAIESHPALAGIRFDEHGALLEEIQTPATIARAKELAREAAAATTAVSDLSKSTAGQGARAAQPRESDVKQSGNYTIPPARQLIAADFDGDGVVDLALFDTQSWSVVTPATGQHRARLAESVVAATTLYTDPEKGPALVTLDHDGVLTLYPQSPARHRFASFDFTGKEEQADSMRSNRDGIGARVALRVGSRWSIVEQFDANSSPGQSLQPMMLGLGGADKADFVALTWSDGVFQTELDLAAGERHRIVETQRQLSSCPVLFAWDGQQYRFITDLLGVGGLGFFVEPGVTAQPRPWEYLLLPDDAIAPLNGKYILKLTEPMEEVAYLDSARLHVYDLPPGMQMVMDDRMVIAGAAATGEPIYYLEEILPIQAINDRGVDVTRAVISKDEVAADAGALDSRFIGRLANPNVITLDFAQALDRRVGVAVLVVDGWVEYPYSQTVFAAWQADADYSAPTLEAYGRDGVWATVAANFGYPAGMPRKMTLPLNELPAGTMRLRLSTNLEVYWDRIAIAYSVDFVPNHQILPLLSATQRRTGFPRRTTGAQRLPSYDYTVRDTFWDTRYMRGSYSAFGPVTELVAATDDAVAIIGPGEEVEMHFVAPDYGPPDAWRRYLVFEVRGWAKDMDMYTRDGDTLAPLPVRVPGTDNAMRDHLHERFHTRFQSGY